jgi:uncharacterized protein YjbI with pentapeptide repeats
MARKVEHRAAPLAWAEVRAGARHGLLVPVLWINWICEVAAYYLGRWSLLEVLEYAGSFSVLFAVVLYFTEAGERRQQKHYQAWKVINTAQGKGGSGGRLDALQQLNEDHVALVGVDVAGAFLQNISLERAELRRATFRAADIRNAHLRGAVLANADLSSANLRNSDLREVDLSDASLTDSDLTSADLRGANLHGAALDKADLRGADLSGVTEWQTIDAIALANVAGVKNAPAGFLEWAAGHGAVQTESTEKWNAQIRAATTEPAGGSR